MYESAAQEASAEVTPGRSRRVIILLAGIVALSLGDLAATLSFLTTIGMIEVNPIAARIIETTGSGLALTAYKALTVGICVGLLYRVRHARAGEIAAWLAVVILGLLAWHWRQYAETFDGSTVVQMVEQGAADERWLCLAE